MAQTSIDEMRANLPARQEYGIGGGALQALDQRETASAAVAAQAKAMVEARYVIALRKPRNWDQVRQDIMGECRRPSFAANKSAYYIKPIGDGVEGLGIRFVEMALRCMTNVLVETIMVYEDDIKEVHRVCVTDLESNTTWPFDVRVSKTVERAKPLDDGSYISVRKNSRGKETFTVPANEDDLLNKRGAQISKAVRTLGLRIIPGDIQDEAEELIKRIRKDKAAADPDAERKRIADAFNEIGVRVSDLTDYLGHSLETCSPAELVKLRGIYGAIKDGEATWRAVVENQAESKPDKPKPSAKPETKAPESKADTKAATETIDRETGEVTTAAGDPGVDLAAILKAIKEAGSIEAVDEQLDLAGGLPAMQTTLAVQAAVARKTKIENAQKRTAME